MVLRANGIVSFPLGLSTLLPTRSYGSSAYDLVQVIRGFGLTARGLRLGVEQLSEVRLPAIAHYSSGHFVVVESCSSLRGSVTVVDPAGGRMRLATAEFAQQFSGVLITVERPPDRAIRRVRMLVRQAVAVVGAPSAALRWRTVPFLLLAPIAIFVPALAIRYFYTDLTSAGHHVTAASCAIAAVVLIAGIALLAMRERSTRLIQDSAQRRRLDSTQRTLRSMKPFFLTVRSAHEVSGEMVEPMVAHEPALLAGLTAVTGLVTSAVGFGLLLSVSALYFAVAAVLALVALTLAVLTGRSLADNQGSEIEELRLLIAQTGLTIEAMEDHRALAADGWLIDRWGSIGRGWLARSGHRRRCLDATLAVQRVMSLVAPVAMLVATYVEISSGRVSLAVALGLNMVGVVTVTTFVTLANDVYRHLRLSPTVTKWDDDAASRIEAPVAQASESPRPTQPSEGSVLDVRALSLGYPHEPCLLATGVEFSVRPGELVTVAGRSGSGKTTLLRVLAGLAEPASGSVVYQPGDHGGQVTAFAAQEPVLPGGPVLDIVRAGHRVGAEDVHRTLVGVGGQDIVDGLPDGLASNLSPRAPELSSGQRRRLALARAAVRKPLVLIVDEPTSGLDRETADAVISYLKGSDAAVVAATHDDRLTAVADVVVDLDRMCVRPGRTGASSARLVET